MAIKLIAVALIAYLIGNINPAIIIGKIMHVDIRKEGSGNAGMTNTIRVIGLWAGILVLIVDVFKAFFAVKLGILITDDLLGGIAAFAAVVIGHCYPAIFSFKGGKGVAASLGAAFALNWPSALAVLIVAAVIFLISGRRMSLASIGAAAAYPAFVYYFVPDIRCLYFAIAAALFLVIKHGSNISRLARGEEESLKIGNKDKSTNADSEGGTK